MEVDQKNAKDMSLADLIKKDRATGKDMGLRGRGGKRGGRGGRGGGDSGRKQGGGQDIMKARRTDGQIKKNKPSFRAGGPNLTREQRKSRQQQVNQPAGGAPRQNFNKSGGQGRRFSDERRPQSGGRGGRGGQGAPMGGTPRQHPQSAGAGGRGRPGALRSRGGLARGGTRQALARPKQSNPNQQRTIRLFDKKPQQKQQKAWHPSEKRLKVRNFDDKQVTNDDLKKLFAKIGEIKICKFDRNEFGQFLGSATVTYDRAEHAKQAIEEYNGAFLDEKVLVVEPDIVIDKVISKAGAVNKLSGGVLLQKQGSNKGMGKTLNIQHNR